MASGHHSKKPRNAPENLFSKTPAIIDEDLINQIEEITFDNDNNSDDLPSISREDLFFVQEKMKKRSLLRDQPKKK